MAFYTILLSSFIYVVRDEATPSPKPRSGKTGKRCVNIFVIEPIWIDPFNGRTLTAKIAPRSSKKARVASTPELSEPEVKTSVRFLVLSIVLFDTLTVRQSINPSIHQSSAYLVYF